MTILDLLAKQYVELTLIKHAYHDKWDVYWLADTPFWKRTTLDVSRDAPVYPYKSAPELRVAGDKEMALPEILREARELYDALENLKGIAKGNDCIRLGYLIEHTKALITRCRFLLGEQLSYNEYTFGMYGLVAPQFDSDSHERTLEELKSSLPGSGDLEKRMRDYKERIRIPRDRISAVVNAAARFFHDAGVKHMGLKECNMPRLRYRDLNGREFVTVLFGYDYDEISLEMNFGRDFPFYLDTIREIAGHELEPGHFTFMNLRTKGMVDTNYPELGLNSHSPSSSFIEGGSRIAIELALDTPQKEREFDELLFDLAGVDRQLAECLPAWRRYAWSANYGKLEIERNLWDECWTKEQALRFAKGEKIVWENADESVLDQFAEDEGHFTSHDYCRDVVRRYYKMRYNTTEEKWAAYTRLCQTPFTMAGIVDGSFDPFAFQY